MYMLVVLKTDQVEAHRERFDSELEAKQAYVKAVADGIENRLTVKVTLYCKGRRVFGCDFPRERGKEPLPEEMPAVYTERGKGWMRRGDQGTFK